MNLAKATTRITTALLAVFALQCSTAVVGKTVEPGDEWRYTVTQGDTLIALVQRLMKPSTDWRELQRLNRLPNPKRMVPGTVVRIPVALLRRDAAVATISLAPWTRP